MPDWECRPVEEHGFMNITKLMHCGGPAQDGKGITFDTIWFLPCMLGQLGTLEVHFIKMFMPKHNVRHNPDLKVKTEIMPIPDEIKALLAQMVTITGLPQEDSPKVYIRRML